MSENIRTLALGQFIIGAAHYIHNGGDDMWYGLWVGAGVFSILLSAILEVLSRPSRTVT